jgi:hypothetical protein
MFKDEESPPTEICAYIHVLLNELKFRLSLLLLLGAVIYHLETTTIFLISMNKMILTLEELKFL